ncbi:hypothetical protein CC80DRAFT_318241 [Byssothecium circinans]|uniref:Uncharacterized protein n=1 Tax=Byssothecium circinans TaxID=147558 RepID=A0A6A5T814_9PLEO|nr:hypothetical protein CC80DRAFT_329641 [Byssothecium circinans]KAF1948284.1 hypothetical protein CC80DRAFT_318241 [Byssothecium circinans]
MGEHPVAARYPQSAMWTCLGCGFRSTSDKYPGARCSTVAWEVLLNSDISFSVASLPAVSEIGFKSLALLLVSMLFLFLLILHVLCFFFSLVFSRLQHSACLLPSHRHLTIPEPPTRTA